MKPADATPVAPLVPLNQKKGTEEKIRNTVRGCQTPMEVKSAIMSLYPEAIVTNIEKTSPNAWHVDIWTSPEGDDYSLTCYIHQNLENLTAGEITHIIKMVVNGIDFSKIYEVVRKAFSPTPNVLVQQKGPYQAEVMVCTSMNIYGVTCDIMPG